MATKIVVYNPIGSDEESIAMIRSAVPQVTLVNPPKESVAAELADAEVFFGFHEPEVFRAAERLRWIQTSSAGMDAILDQALIGRELLITNASGVYAPQVAAAAWAMTLAIARGLPTFFRQQQEHRWEWGPLYALDGATAGVVGLGGIGRRYAKIAAALGMRVLAVDAHEPPKPDEVDEIWKMDRLEELMATVDVLLISCPYTADTHNLISRSRLAKMKPTGILVNIARGGIVDEAALRDALIEGRLAGAGLDVTETEPLPSDSPLWDTPNLIITPHCAGLSPQRDRKMTEFFCDNLRRYLAGEPLLNVVDQKRGYPIPQSS